MPFNQLREKIASIQNIIWGVVMFLITYYCIVGLIWLASDEADGIGPGSPECSMLTRESVSWNFLACDTTGGWVGVHLITGIATWMYLPDIVFSFSMVMLGETIEWICFGIVLPITGVNENWGNESPLSSHVGDVVIQGWWGLFIGYLIWWFSGKPIPDYTWKNFVFAVLFWASTIVVSIGVTLGIPLLILLHCILIAVWYRKLYVKVDPAFLVLWLSVETVFLCLEFFSEIINPWIMFWSAQLGVSLVLIIMNVTQ